MASNKYERDFTAQAHLKRAGRVDLRLFQHTPVLGDGFGGLQYMIHKMLGGVFNKFVIEGCQYTGGAVQQGYILYEGKVVEIEGESIAVASGEWLYLDSTGSANVTSTEATAMANCLIYMKEADATPHDIRFRTLDSVMNLYQLTVNQDIDLYGDHIDLHDGNLDDVATIDGGGDAVQMDDNLNMNAKDLNNIGSNNVNINSLIQAEIDQIANINAVTIINDQWGYLGASDQGIATTDSPTFDNLTISTDINITGEILFPSATIHSSGTDIHIHPNIGNADGNLILHPVGSNTGSCLFVRNSVTGNYGDFIIKLSGTTASLESALGGGGTAPDTLNINDADWDNINIGDASATITINAVGISAAQFGYVGQMNQRVDSSYGSVSFAGLTSTSTVVISGQNIDSVDNIYLEDDIIHKDDPDTLISFGTNTIDFRAGGGSQIDITTGGVRIGAGDQRVDRIENTITNNPSRLTTSAAVFAHSNAKTNPHEVTLDQARADGNSFSGAVDLNRNSLLDLGELVMGNTSYSVPTYPNTNGGWGLIAVWQVDTNHSSEIGRLLKPSGDGNLDRADKDYNERAVAISLESGTGDKKVLLLGIIRNDEWGFGSYIGKPVYLSGTGVVSATPPTVAGDFVQVVGVVLASNKIYFNPDMTMIELF